MDAVIQLIEEGRKNINVPEEAAEGKENSRTVRNWVSIEQAGMNFRGRFAPDNEYDPADFDARLSPESKINFEVWLRETTTLAVNTEINIQLGEFTIKKHVTQPLDVEIQEHIDFESVFGHVTNDDIIQCAEVKHTTNRQWLRLVGLGHDVQVWNIDTRIPTLPRETSKDYPDQAPQWLQEIIEPWRNMVLSNIDLFITSAHPETSESATLYGFTKSSNNNDNNNNYIPTLKEIRVYRYPRVFHIYNILEYGRRWFRSMIFSSDPFCTLHRLHMETFFVKDRLYQCCGNPKIKVERTKSLLINRYLNEDVDEAQTYIPTRYFHGIMPSALIETYSFWQNIDDSITGYMPNINGTHMARSILQITLYKDDKLDVTGYGFSHANSIICRIFTLEDISIKDFSFYTIPDPEKLPLYLVDLMSVLSKYHARHHLQSTRPIGTPNVLKEFLDFSGENKTIHALIHLLLRLEPLSHILAWSKNDPTKISEVSIDIIELPRLRLSFEKVIHADGTVKYMCVEQSGYFIASYTSDLNFIHLLDGIPNALLLANQDNEYLVLIPATMQPGLIPHVEKQSFKLICNMMNDDWIIKTGDQTFFLYPIHSSGNFMASRSISATLYLLVLRLMTRNYTEAYRLIESCVCDRTLTSQEQQIYDLISKIPDCLLADLFACRLKLYFVTYGCSEIMPYPFDIEEDILEYITHYKFVSSTCRLTIDEEMFIISRIPEKSPKRTIAFLNREKILRASFDLTFEYFSPKLQVKNITPIYPKATPLPTYNSEPLDLELINIDKPHFKSMLQKLSFAKYHRPDLINGPDAVKYVLELFDKEIDLGFFVLYELMTGSLNICILPDHDKSRDLASILLHCLPEKYIYGLQRVILIILEAHPSLCDSGALPIFKDERRFKVPTLAGLDIFQTHVKTVATYLKNNARELDFSKLVRHVPEPYHAPFIIQASDTVDDSVDFSSGRTWLNPKILDFTCEKRVITHAVIPSTMHSFVKHYDSIQIQFLTGLPLDEIELHRFIEYKNLDDRGELKVSSSSPLRVMNHPSSRSHIARTSVSRLENDIIDFASDENQNKLPVMKSVGIDSLIDDDKLEISVGEMFKLISALSKLRDNDSTFSRSALKELLNFTNGDHATHQNNVKALGHLIRQASNNETSLVRFSFKI